MRYARTLLFYWSAMRPYLIDKILPAHEVHLFGGPSGAGKTRMLFQWLQEWQSKSSVMGFPAKKQPKLGYVAMDRTEPSVRETMDSIFRQFPIVMEWRSLVGLANLSAEILVKGYADFDLLIIDGIASMVPDGKIIDYRVVAQFLASLSAACQKYDTTLLGILHSTKTKENETFLNPRQRIAGSVAWAAYSETIFMLDPIKPDNPEECQRKLFVLPRNAGEFTKLFRFNPSGRLEEVLDAGLMESEQVVLGIIRTGTSDRREIVQLASQLGISRPSVDRVLRHLLELGLIHKSGRGEYVEGSEEVVEEPVSA